ncbi:MAG: hypothetical protein CMM26_01360 [Rhodospirillaceae bacterium]|nr:hypothetical protein [Rhodospirillaceae bacterium]
MPVAEFTLGELSDSLASIGIVAGDTVLMHSSLLHIGMLAGCPPREIPDRVISGLLDYLGPKGTLAVLAPCYDYSNDNIPFDTRKSPVAHELGILSAALAARPDALRSANPTFSLAAVGPGAENICIGSNASAFGAGSAWERTVEAGAKILLLGSEFQRMTLVRFIEQRAGVPYLYVKYFQIPVFRDGIELDLPVTALLRYAHLPLQYDLSGFETLLRDANILHEAAIGGGFACALDAAQCVQAGLKALASDLHYFLASLPAYDDAELPMT